jgi:hypothetical protein
VSDAGHRLKFYYATQVRQAPPTFLLFVNRDELFSDQYKKSLASEMRTAFGYEGCPIVLVPKARPKTIAPMRKFKPAHEKIAAKFGANTGPRTGPRAGFKKHEKKAFSKGRPRGSNRAKGRR